MRATVASRISRGVTPPRRISAARARASWSSSRASIDKTLYTMSRLHHEQALVGQGLAGLPDARASLLQRLGRGRVGHPEVGRQAEGLALHRGDADRLQQVGDEVLVGLDHLAVRRLLADAAGAGGIDVEGPFRLMAVEARSDGHPSE